MNTDRDASLQSDWPLAAQCIRNKWAKLSDPEIHAIDGSAERLTSSLQRRYGYSRERAEQECGAVCAQLGSGVQERRGWQAMGPLEGFATTMSGRSYRGARSLGADECIEQARAGGQLQHGGSSPGEPLEQHGQVEASLRAHPNGGTSLA